MSWYFGWIGALVLFKIWLGWTIEWDGNLVRLGWESLEIWFDVAV